MVLILLFLTVPFYVDMFFAFISQAESSAIFFAGYCPDCRGGEIPFLLVGAWGKAKPMLDITPW